METVHCSHCGSEEISGTSEGCFWDYEKQAWAIGDMVENITCEDCGNPTEPVHKEQEQAIDF